MTMDMTAFEVRNPETGEHMAVYEDGRIKGFPAGYTCVVNRIPLITQVRREEAYALGWKAAMDHVAPTVTELREAAGRVQQSLDIIRKLRMARPFAWWRPWSRAA